MNLDHSYEISLNVTNIFLIKLLYIVQHRPNKRKNEVRNAYNNQIAIYRWPTIADIIHNIKRALVSLMKWLEAVTVSAINKESISRQTLSDDIRDYALTLTDLALSLKFKDEIIGLLFPGKLFYL